LLQIWVEADSRRRGVGSELLRLFEDRARRRGCRIFYLTTLSFQAPEFYRKRGYKTLAEITGYPNDIRKYLMHRVDD
jgi:ribosomal protein S18 acetylase RimI-like enzyme